MARKRGHFFAYWGMAGIDIISILFCQIPVGEGCGVEERPKNRLELTGRRLLVLDGVEQVGTFDEKEISLATNMGFLLLKGEGMHITELNLEKGKLTVEGLISLMQFVEGKSIKGAKDKGKNILNRIFK